MLPPLLPGPIPRRACPYRNIAMARSPEKDVTTPFCVLTLEPMCARNTAITLVPVLLSPFPDGHQAPKGNILTLTRGPAQDLKSLRGSEKL